MTSKDKRVSDASGTESLLQRPVIEKGIKQMSDTTNEQNDSKKSPDKDNDKDIHINCGTPECCGECETEEDKQ